MKTAMIQIRLSPKDKRIIEKAARQTGLSLSGWIRMQLLAASKKDMPK